MQKAIKEPKKIYVNNHDLGFWTQVEIPVVRYDETSECCGAPVSETGFCTDCKDNAEPRHEIVYCNHGGAEVREEQQQIDRIDQPDIVCQDPSWADRTNASITTMFPRAVSSETGTDPTPRIASENASA